MDKNELLKLINALRLMKIQDKELWSYLTKGLVTLMNTRQLNCKQLLNVTWELYNLKLKSSKLYEFIVTYFIA